MSERRTIPHTNDFDRFFVVENLPGHCRPVLGTSERDYQVQLRSSIDYPTDAAKNSIHFAKCTKAIDVNRLQIGSLRKQFFVCHKPPPYCARAHLNTTGWFSTQENHSCDAFVSIDAPCGFRAPQHHHTGLCTRPCRVCKIEHVNETDNLTLISNPEFVQATPHECAPAADSRPQVPAVAGVNISGRLS